MSDQPIVTGVDFVPLPTQNFERTVDFYENVRRIPKSKQNSDAWAEFETGNLTLGVMNVDRFGIPFFKVANGIALHVEDVEAARAELEEAGVEFKAPTLDTGVCHMAFFRDPEGNELLLHHRYAPKDA